MAAQRNPRLGMGAGLAAYVMWGMLPAYWKLLEHVSPFEVLANRIVWTAILTTAALAIAGRLPELGAAVTNRRSLLAGAASSFLISANGLTFIWAVANDRITETSLGYYINPLFNVLLGFLFLREKLTHIQIAAVLLAAIGVANLAVGTGELPWVSLVLAACFGGYGLVRKTAPVESLVGLSVEMSLATPLALVYLVLVPESSFGVLGTGTTTDQLLLLASGVASAVPLWLFTIGTRNLRYATMGILMYVAPTGQLALAVLVYGEDFTTTHAVTFGCIWVAIALYVSEALRHARRAEAR